MARGDEVEDSGDDVRRASRGDSRAAERVLARWAPAVERYLRRNAGAAILVRESAADLAQSVCREALERLVRGDLEYRGEAALRQWLYGAADLKVKNRRRYYGAHRRAAAGEAPLEAAEVALDPGVSPSTAAAEGEDHAAFARALDALEEKQRDAVRLFHLEGLDHAAVADRLGITPGHSRTLVARGLARLARLLREGAR